MSDRTAERLYRRLPAIHRIHDAAQGQPLRALLAAFGDEVDVLEEDIARLYDNWFIETCDEWTVPYIADLIGERGLLLATAPGQSQRARVAHALACRRRRGTAGALERVARDVTGWPARVIESFAEVAATQFLDHPHTERLGTAALPRSGATGGEDPAGTLPRTVDLRSPSAAAGQPLRGDPAAAPSAVDLRLWRLESYALEGVTACPAADGRSYSFNPLGLDTPLFNVPRSEPDIDQRVSARDVPGPLLRADLSQDLRRRQSAELRDAESLGERTCTDPMLCVALVGPLDQGGREAAPQPLLASELVVMDLSHPGLLPPPTGARVAVDPELGRLRFLRDPPEAGQEVLVTAAYGFSGDLGGGPYPRAESVLSMVDQPTWITAVARDGSAPHRGLAAALAEWNGVARKFPGSCGVIALLDSRTYEEDLAAHPIVIPEEGQLLIVAARWPGAEVEAAPAGLLRLASDLDLAHRTAARRFDRQRGERRGASGEGLHTIHLDPMLLRRARDAGYASPADLADADEALVRRVLDLPAAPAGESGGPLEGGGEKSVRGVTLQSFAGASPEEDPLTRLKRLVEQLRMLVPEGVRPHLRGALAVQGTAPAGSTRPGRLWIDGLLIEGSLTVRPGSLGALQLSHCTLAGDGHIRVQPPHRDRHQRDRFETEETAIEIQTETADIALDEQVVRREPRSLDLRRAHLLNLRLTVTLDHSLCGPILLTETVPALRLLDSIVAGRISAPGADAEVRRSTWLGPDRAARDEAAGERAGEDCYEALTLEVRSADGAESVVVEESHGHRIVSVVAEDEESTTVLAMDVTEAEEGRAPTAALEVGGLVADHALFGAPIQVRRRQEGCVRWSYLTRPSQTPPCYRCSTGAEAERPPLFVSTRHGDPGYAQLAHAAGTAGAAATPAGQRPDLSPHHCGEGGAEVGAFHELRQAEREAGLQACLDEYLRFGIQPTITFVT